MGFYKNAADDMRQRRMRVEMANIPRLTALRAAVIEPKPRPSKGSGMNPDDKRDDKSHRQSHEKPGAKHDSEHVEGLHKEAQNPDQQRSSRGGGGLEPSAAPVLLLHRRGRSDSSMLQDFDDESKAREYAKEHKLMIVYAEKVGQQVKLYYLPE
jgi:hypothetical protein